MTPRWWVNVVLLFAVCLGGWLLVFTALAMAWKVARG